MRVEAIFFALFLAVYGSIIVANIALFASCVGWVCALVISGALHARDVVRPRAIDPENVVNGQYVADAMAGYLGGGSPTVTTHTIKYLCKNKAPSARPHEAVAAPCCSSRQVNLGFVLTHKRRGLSVERPSARQALAGECQGRGAPSFLVVHGPTCPQTSSCR